MDTNLVSVILGVFAVLTGINHVVNWEQTTEYARSVFGSLAKPANALGTAALVFGGALTAAGYDLGNYIVAAFMVAAAAAFHRGKEEFSNFAKNLAWAAGAVAAAGGDVISEIPNWIA